MRGRIGTLSSALVVAITTTTVLLAQTPQTPPPVFRTTADVINVDVGVKHNGDPVADLKASDFLLLDNGVPQRVEIVDMETVPVDVTILVDTTGDIEPYMGSLNDQLRKIAALVRPDDRLRVLTFDTYVTEIVPLQRAATHPPFPELKSAGLSSAHDALAAALMQADPDRPNLIIALTDSIDSISTLNSEAVRDIARQSNATLHISWVTMAKPPMDPTWYSVAERTPGGIASALFGNPGGMSQGSGVPTHRYWLPYNESPTRRTTHDFLLLREAAALTGGKLHEPGIFNDVTATAIFKHAFEDFRRSYLLRYTPQGVSREGWHDIKVTLPAHKGYTINARRGYAIDAGGPSSTTANESAPRVEPPPTAPHVPTLADLTAAYGRADYAGAEALLGGISDHVKWIRDFRSGGNPWPTMPHREGVFVLELAAPALVDQDYAARDAARQMLAWYGPIVRQPLGLGTFEHDWLSAELQMLQGVNQPAMALPLVAKAIARFPDDPRFLLADAIVADQLTRDGALDAAGPQARTAIAKYDAAITHGGAAFEARVREAWLFHRLGRDADALTMLDAAGDRAPDATVSYFRDYIRSEVLAALGRPHDAATAPAGRPDPWSSYWQGDYRFYPASMTHLRELVRGR